MVAVTEARWMGKGTGIRNLPRLSQHLQLTVTDPDLGLQGQAHLDALLEAEGKLLAVEVTGDSKGGCAPL